MRSVCCGSETSEHLAAQAAAYVKTSCLIYAKSEAKFKQSLTRALGATTRLPKNQHVNSSLNRTGKRRWNSSITWLREFIQTHNRVSFVLMRHGKGMTELIRWEDMSQLVQHFFACFKICRSSGTFSIILPVSPTSGAKVLCWIDLPSTSPQLPGCAEENIVQRNLKRCASSPTASETRHGTPAFETARSPQLVDEVHQHTRFTGRENLQQNHVGTTVCRTGPSALSAHASTG